jgi:RHS repeat-associated protein
VWAIGYYASDDIATLDMTPAVASNALSAMPATQMTFDAANRLATFNGQTVAHDADGNMVSGPLPTTGAMGNYTYDSRNRLTSAGGSAYRYNAEGNRVGLTSANETTTLTVDPQGALPKVLERVKNGVRTRYVYGAGLQYEVNDAGSATYYHYDQSGNTAALTNQAGAIIERVVYSPYGTIRYRQSNFDTPFLYGGFFGVMTDANGLINMRARYYNPLTMRFLNSDPAMDGLNWYAYANGNPISNSDPSGLAANISIGYTQVPGFGIHGQHHTFTIIQDTETGEQMVTRAGPSAADGGFNPIGMGLGFLQADVRNYQTHKRDNPSATLHIQPVGVIEGNYADVVGAAQSFRDVTNSNQITYSPVGGGVAGLNSNSYTGTFIQSLGFSRPTPDLPSPGFQNGRASPSISYTPFSTGVTAPSVYSTQPKKSNK